ncbi:MAG: hypothetical protein ABW065_00845 [Solirubrobacterales bacterium]
MSNGAASPGPAGSGDAQQNHTTQDKVQEATGQAQDKAREAAGKAQKTLQEQVDQRTKQAGEQVSGTAGDLRSVGEELRKQGKDGPAKIADRAAEQTEKVGSYLSGTGPDQMLHDVEDFGRQRPWAMLAGGLALGAVAARFLKASSRSRYQQRSASSGSSQPRALTPSPAQPPASRVPEQTPRIPEPTPKIPEPTGSPVVAP